MLPPVLDRWLAAVLETPGLTAIKDPAAARATLLDDALKAVAIVEATPGGIVDVGSGGGTPGIPLAATLPDRAVTLLEAERRKCAFLERWTSELPNLSVVWGRAEEQTARAVRRRGGEGLGASCDGGGMVSAARSGGRARRSSGSERRPTPRASPPLRSRSEGRSKPPHKGSWRFARRVRPRTGSRAGQGSRASARSPDHLAPRSGTASPSCEQARVRRGRRVTCPPPRLA